MANVPNFTFRRRFNSPWWIPSVESSGFVREEFPRESATSTNPDTFSGRRSFPSLERTTVPDILICQESIYIYMYKKKKRRWKKIFIFHKHIFFETIFFFFHFHINWNFTFLFWKIWGYVDYILCLIHITVK